MRPVSNFARILVATALLSGCAALSRPPPASPGSAAARAGAPPAPGGGLLVPIPAPLPPTQTTVRVTIGAVGDVLMHEAVKRSAETHGKGAPDAGYAWLFEPIADLLAQPDLTFANLETPIAPRAGAAVREYVFNALPVVVSALQHAGVDIVSVANNHAFDQGRGGFEETLHRLEEAGMRYVGAGPAGRAAGPVRVEVNGLTLAFLGYAHFFNQDGNACPATRERAPPCVQASLLDRARAVEDVRAAAAQADAVVVSLHWGDEYQGQPRAEDVELAHRLADAGALVVIGHHPHVLQPIELYRRADGSHALIAYSLGNFVSNQSRGYVPGISPEKEARTRDGALLRVALERRDYGRGVSRVEVAGADWLPLWTENDTAELDRARGPQRRPAIQVVSVDRALATVRTELATFPDPVPAQRREAWIRLRRREALFLAREKAIAGVLGEDLERTLSATELDGPGHATQLSPPAAAR